MRRQQGQVLKRIIAGVALGVTTMVASAAPNEQHFPLIGWRTGPLASMGISLAAGWIDYM